MSSAESEDSVGNKEKLMEDCDCLMFSYKRERESSRALRSINTQKQAFDSIRWHIPLTVSISLHTELQDFLLLQWNSEQAWSSPAGCVTATGKKCFRDFVSPCRSHSELAEVLFPRCGRNTTLQFQMRGSLLASSFFTMWNEKCLSN